MKCNREEHELWNRRSFLKGLGLFGVGSMVYANSNIVFAKNTELTNAINQADNDNILLIIKLFGGNDGLNMIVPVNQYDIYANHRPTLKIPESKLIKLNDDYSIPDFMNSMEPLWKEGKMKVVHSTGYDNQTLSHFRGSDSWDSTEVNSIVQNTGWLGRYYDNVHKDFLLNPPECPVAIQIGSARNITFDGVNNNYSYSVANITSLQNILETGKVHGVSNVPDCEYGENVSFLRNSYNNSFSYAGIIHDAYNSSSNYTGGVGGYPASTDKFGRLGESLNVIARLIKGNLGTKVYMVTLGGFDTHVKQFDTHQGLLTNIAESISYFHEDLTQACWGDKVLTMSHSEFGRRVAENGSNGTDHGAAGPIMFFGEGLNGSGFVGEHSDLEDLNFGNLKHHTDFRQAYSTVLKNWMCVDNETVNSVVLGQAFDDLNLGFNCQSEDTQRTEEPEDENEEPIVVEVPEEENIPPENDIDAVDLEDDNIEALDLTKFDTYSTYENGNTMLVFNSNKERHVNVTLHNLNGQEMGVLAHNINIAGTTKINLNEQISNLAPGIYIYKVFSESYLITKKVLVK